MNSEKEHIEKRKHPRFSIGNQYTIILNGNHYKGIIGNISLGGVYLSTISPEITLDSIFQDCEITMNLDKTEISLPCSISFIAPKHSQIGNGVGIAFSTVSEESMTVLVHFIENIQHSTQEVFN